MPNPLWDLKAKKPVGDPPFIMRPVDDMDRKFVGKSTFSDSYDAGLEAHPQEYPFNVTHTGQLRPPGAKPLHAYPSPFYTTEYMQKSEEGNLLMAAKRVLPPGPPPRARAQGPPPLLSAPPPIPTPPMRCSRAWATVGPPPCLRAVHMSL